MDILTDTAGKGSIPGYRNLQTTSVQHKQLDFFLCKSTLSILVYAFLKVEPLIYGKSLTVLCSVIVIYQQILDSNEKSYNMKK